MEANVFFSGCVRHNKCVYHSQIMRESSVETTEAAHWKGAASGTGFTGFIGSP